MKYNRDLQAILSDKVSIANNVNATAIPVTEAANGNAACDQGAAQKFALDPHGMVKA